MLKNYTTSPILVTGAPRSGKSLLVQTLVMGGAFVGQVDGLFHNEKVEKAVNTMLFSSAYNPSPIIDALKTDGYTENKKWLFKSCAIAQHWSTFAAQFPNAKFVIVRRRREDVLYALQQTKYHTSLTEDGWNYKLDEIDSRCAEMINAGLNVHVIWLERMVNGNYQSLYELVNWLGLTWHPAMLSTLDSKLQKSKSQIL